MRRALIVGVILVAACEGGSATGIDLAIRYDDGLEIDRLALSASAGGEAIAERTLLPEGGQPLSETGRESVVVLVADELDGNPVVVQVDGLAGGDVVASGQVTVVVARGQLVAAEVNLRPGGGGGGCTDWEWAAGNVDPCEAPSPDGALVLDQPGVYTIDTETGQIATPDGDSLVPASDLVAQPEGPMLRRVAVDQLVVESSAVLEATGPHALLFAVWGDATIDGTIDVSARPDADGGGGGDAARCANATGGVAGEAGDDESGAGGGGGGAYLADGGDGGDGKGAAKGSKGAKGRAIGSPMLVPLRGGCPGGLGGDAFDAGESGGSGGFAGGAIQIAARDSLSLGGSIRAAGGGGFGGAVAATNSGSGGGGGGSGGAIFLESFTIELAGGARICANGGSGGEGGHADHLGAGGNPGACSLDRAETDDAVSGGGNGGRGGASDAPAGENGKSGGSGDGGGNGGGGGGGGGVGRVRLNAVGDLNDRGAVVSPPAQ